MFWPDVNPSSHSHSSVIIMNDSSHSHLAGPVLAVANDVHPGEQPSVLPSRYVPGLYQVISRVISAG